MLAVSKGASFSEAAHRAGRRCGNTVSKLVVRFNETGLAALESRYYNCGKLPIYNKDERARIIKEFERPPDRETDGCASWSLSLLRDALRRAPDGLPAVSTYTLWKVLHEAGYTCQEDRTWCKTGEVMRKRKKGIVKVIDPDSEAKKTN
ncbi:MAG: helix-turn-helix domain-containing protein [Rhodothermales bacterium]